MPTIAEGITQSSFETLSVAVCDATLTVSIDRPKALNAINPTVIAELTQVFTTLAKLGQTGEQAVRDGADRRTTTATSATAADAVDPGTDEAADAVDPGGTEADAHSASESPDWSVRGVILTGAGEKSFVAGADISVMQGMRADEAASFAEQADRLTQLIETVPVPVIAAVNGYAFGGGLELAMSADIIFASENAAFGQPEVGLGLIPGFGGCVRLQQWVGRARARDLTFTGRHIDAAEAERLGLVAEALPSHEALRARTHEFLALTQKQSPVAVARAKHTMREVAALPVSDGLTTEQQRFAECFNTADMREGTTAFIEKRTPIFPGK